MTDLNDIRETYSMGLDHRAQEFDEYMAGRDQKLLAMGYSEAWSRATNAHPSWWTDAEYSKNPYRH